MTTRHFSRACTLFYDGIMLLPANTLCTKWHVHGREILSTPELIRRAVLRGVTVVRRDSKINGVSVHLLT